MNRANRHALKEWGAVDRALGEGQTALVLRKGGIWERRGSFQVEHREFWIFPTLYHQNAAELAEPLRTGVDERASLAGAPLNEPVLINHYAVVAEALRVEDLDALQRLEGLHPLTPDAVERRFHYRNRPYLHAVLLRIHSCPEPHRVTNTPQYEGCVSWVELDEELATAHARPVLSDSEFDSLHSEMLRRLGDHGTGHR